MKHQMIITIEDRENDGVDLRLEFNPPLVNKDKDWKNLSDHEQKVQYFFVKIAGVIKDEVKGGTNE